MEEFQFTKKEVLQLLNVVLEQYTQEELIVFLKNMIKEDNKVEINPSYVGSNFDEFLEEEDILLECTKIAEEKVDNYKDAFIYKHSFSSVKEDLLKKINNKRNYRFTAQSVQDLYNVGRNLSVKVINSLKEEGVVVREGSGKFCSYKGIV